MNDADDMSALLQKLLGFQSGGITVLHDAQATKANIMNNLKDMVDGDWHGAFTYYFCKEMYACNNKHSREQVLTRVRDDLAAGYFSQTPQLECEATRRRSKIG